MGNKGEKSTKEIFFSTVRAKLPRSPKCLNTGCAKMTQVHEDVAAPAGNVLCPSQRFPHSLPAARYTASMVRRWLIRGLGVALLTLCAVALGASYWKNSSEVSPILDKG